MLTDFSPKPHEEAIKLIENKPVVTRAVFDGLLPELRGRAFTITGVEGAHVMQRVRDSIAGLAGSDKTWDVIKEEVVSELEPYLGEGKPSENRAVLLMRTHGFQAFQASNWRTIQADEDTTHIQYLATEDTHVRDTHLALNGIILPKGDPFWEKHYPPWEWGCRCRGRPMNPDLVDEARQDDESRNPDDKLVMEGPALDKLNQGHLQRDGQSYNVTAPSDSGEPGAFQWHPGDLRLSLEDLEKRYDPEVWAGFKAFAESTKISPRNTVWQWLSGASAQPPSPSTSKPPKGASALPPTPNAQPPAPASLTETLQALELNTETVTAEKMAQLWAEMVEHEPVPIDEMVRFKARKSGVLSEANLREHVGAVISRLPPAVVRSLPKIEVAVEPTKKRGVAGGYDYTARRLVIAPSVAKRGTDEVRRVIYHELLHWVHIHGPADYAATIKEHFEARTAGEPMQILPFPGIVVGKKDKWTNIYAGRVYGGRNAELEKTHLGIEIPSTNMEIMGLTPEKMAVHWNRPEDRETLMKVLRIFFNRD